MKKGSPEVLAIRAALKLAEVACDAYPTPEGWNDRRRQNTRTVQAAYRALDSLSKRPAPPEHGGATKEES